MARTVDEIKQGIYDNMATRPSLAAIVNNPSQTAIWKDFVHSIAVEIGVLEQVIDAYIEEIEGIASQAIVPSRAWLRQKVMEFQYDSGTPQVIQLIDFVPSYPVVDESLRIITRCMIKNNTDVYVAKSDPPTVLSAPELTALQGYLTDRGNGTVKGTGIGYCGQELTVYSVAADKLWIECEVVFFGQYKAVIADLVETAINDYMAGITDGIVRVVDLQGAILDVPGVTDLLIENLQIRDHTEAFGSGTDLIVGFDLQLNEHQLTSGYVIEEDTALNTFADTIDYTVPLL